MSEAQSIYKIERTVFNRDKVNQARGSTGLPPIHSVWCHICKKANAHWWWQCPNVRCNICYNDHPTFLCESLYICNWCGSNKHISEACVEEKTVIAKANMRRRCYRCGYPGHIAAYCNNMPSIRGRWKWRRRTGRRRRGRGRKRRGRKANK